MTTLRQPFYELSPEVYNALVQAKTVSHHFSEQEQAALAWAESVTDIARTHAEDDVYLPLLTHFSAREISDLTFAVGLMNCFNRLAVGMRM